MQHILCPDTQVTGCSHGDTRCMNYVSCVRQHIWPCKSPTGNTDLHFLQGKCIKLTVKYPDASIFFFFFFFFCGWIHDLRLSRPFKQYFSYISTMGG